MDYDPKTMVAQEGTAPRKPQPGEYAFTVNSATEKTFNSGNKGVELELGVDAGGTNIRVFSRLVYTPKALWRVKQCLDSVGVSFDPPPEVATLVGLRGKADFVEGERGYLEVGKFLPAEHRAAPEQPQLSYPPSPTRSAGNRNHYDDVPF